MNNWWTDSIKTSRKFGWGTVVIQHQRIQQLRKKWLKQKKNEDQVEFSDSENSMMELSDTASEDEELSGTSEDEEFIPVSNLSETSDFSVFSVSNLFYYYYLENIE